MIKHSKLNENMAMFFRVKQNSTVTVLPCHPSRPVPRAPRLWWGDASSDRTTDGSPRT